MSKQNFCWSCKSQIDGFDFFCTQCHIIQPPFSTLQKQDPFVIFGLKKAFDIDDKEVDKRYFELQRQLHPDSFATQTAREKMYAAQQSMIINDIYNLIKSPLERADYLCVSLGGKSYKDEAQNVPPALLMQSITQREALSQAADNTSLQTILTQNQSHQKKLIDQLSQDYHSQSENEMAQTILALKYALRFNQEIKDKLAKITNKDTNTPMALSL